MKFNFFKLEIFTEEVLKISNSTWQKMPILSAREQQYKLEIQLALPISPNTNFSFDLKPIHAIRHPVVCVRNFNLLSTLSRFSRKPSIELFWNLKIYILHFQVLIKVQLYWSIKWISINLQNGKIRSNKNCLRRN